MSVSDEVRNQLAAKLQVVFPHLDERQRRLMMGAEARMLGHGGIRAVARAAQVSEATVREGVDELEAGEEPLGRVRRPGGGRKRAADLDPGLRNALLALVEPDERGDPMSPLRWTVKSTRSLAATLTGQGHRVSADTVGDLLREEGFSLQAGAKTLEGRQHPDRDAQFRYLNEQARGHMDAGQPVISVDAKKKELVGDYKNAGRQWRPAGEPVTVKTHDLLDRQGPGNTIPYGIYDIAANTGWVSVGTDHDTAAFAVASIRRWWQPRGRHDYPGATRLLITADAGGSNGYRTRAWKTELAALAAETGLDIRCLRNPELTGMPEPALNELISQLAQAMDELREQGRLRQRGGERIRARGAGAKDKLTSADRVLATVLYLRKLGTRDLLAQLFGVNTSTLTRAVHQVQPLLAEHGCTIPPSTARFRTPADVTAFLANSSPTKIKPAC